jgi:hypothetical protein
MVNVGVERVIWPAAPVAEAVLKSPLPKPENDADSVAVRVRFPPWPSLIVLLSIRAPPVCVRLLTFSAMLPAAPVPEVAAEIVPLSLIVKVGAVTAIVPPGPVPEAVLKIPLLGSVLKGLPPTSGFGEFPEMDTESAAMITFPPEPKAPSSLLLVI